MAHAAECLLAGRYSIEERVMLRADVLRKESRSKRFMRSTTL